MLLLIDNFGKKVTLHSHIMRLVALGGSMVCTVSSGGKVLVEWLRICQLNGHQWFLSLLPCLFSLFPIPPVLLSPAVAYGWWMMMFAGYLRVNGNGLLWPEAAGQGLWGINSSDSCFPDSSSQIGKFCSTTAILTFMELDFFTALHLGNRHFKWNYLI